MLETLGPAVSPGRSRGTPSTRFSRSSSDPGVGTVPSPQARREDSHRHDAGPPGLSATLILASSQSRAQLRHEGRRVRSAGRGAPREQGAGGPLL